MGKNQWVSPNGGNWSVHGEGNGRATKVFDNKCDAVEYAKGIAKNQKSELFIQGRNGRFQSKDSYGNDPCPPRDKEH